MVRRSHYDDMRDTDPFENLLVVELANVLAGPAVGMFFAELGARVVKVENPRTGGDVTRSWRTVGEPTDRPGAYFSSVNWGKESIAVDLATEEGRAIVHDLVRRADVVLSSYKRGDARRLGMDWPSLSKLNPELVYGEISAYGQDSPRVGYDAVIQAETGFTSMNGTEESGPLKMPVALMDLLAGHQLKEGILVELLRRERSGRGARVSVSLFEAGVAALANQAANTLMTGTPPSLMGSGHPNIVPYGTAYRCRDGRHLVVAVGTDDQFRRLGRCVDRPDLGEDPRFETNPDRVRHRVQLEESLSMAVARLDGETLIRRLREQGVPAGFVRDVREALADPVARSLLLGHASGAAAVRTRAFRSRDAFERDLTPPPELAKDTHRVLTDLLGYSPRVVDALNREGVIVRAALEDGG